jgi:chromate transporter
MISGVFYGVSPAVIALILHFCHRLARLGMEDRLQWGIAAECLAITVGLRAEVALLFLISGRWGVAYGTPLKGKCLPAASMLVAIPPAVGGGSAAAPILGKLLVLFFKAGLVTFGSGLVIVPFLEQGLVRQTGWLDERQFLVAVAIGMLSPGPVVITPHLWAISSRDSGERPSRPWGSFFPRSCWC